jgi:acyl dehydratase
VSDATRSHGEPELDVSDVARWVGVPIGGPQPKEPFSVNDVRRFVQAFANPNPLHFDEGYAAESRFGTIVAPQSYFGGGPATGAIASNQGHVPGSHMLFGGDEQWFYGPRVFPGDHLRLDRMLFDYKVTTTSFAGPTLFSRGDTTYVNQRGEILAKQRSTAIRYRAEDARERESFAAEREAPVWTAEALETVEEQRLAWIRAFRDLGHEPRLWGTVQVGDRLPTRVVGPHSIQTLTTEHRSDAGGWGSYFDAPLPITRDPGFIPEMQRDQGRLAIDPNERDGLHRGPGRGHVNPEYAERIGMPRSYGYGASMCVWVVDYLPNGAGEWGFLRHHDTRYRNPAFVGDVTYVDGEVTEMFLDPNTGAATVRIAVEMTNQKGAQLARGVAEVELPVEDPRG